MNVQTKLKAARVSGTDRPSFPNFTGASSRSREVCGEPCVDVDVLVAVEVEVDEGLVLDVDVESRSSRS